MLYRTMAVLALASLLLALQTTPARAQGGSNPPEGHLIEGDTLTFVFDPVLYGVEAFESVAVKGNFNDSNPETPGWQLSDDDGDGVWTLEVPLGERIKAGTPFLFALDGAGGAVLSPPAGVDADFLVSTDQGDNLLVVGGLESFLANDPFASRLERQTFTNEKGGELNYYLHMPENYDAAQAYPLVLFLHGAGERGNSPAPILPYNGAYEILETAADYDYFMLVPQAPADHFWWEPDIQQSLLALIAAVQDEYSIDASRIYITGLSLGAFGLWNLVYEAPDVFAAGISVAGAYPAPELFATGMSADAYPGILEGLELSRMTHIPFLMFHGTDDPLVPVGLSQALAAALEEAGGTVEYTEYEGARHWIWVRTYTNPKVTDWLFGQAKS